MTARRNLVLILVGAAIVAALVLAFMPRPVAVDIATAYRGDFTVTVEEEGKTRVIDRFVVSAPVAPQPECGDDGNKADHAEHALAAKKKHQHGAEHGHRDQVRRHDRSSPRSFARSLKKIEVDCRIIMTMPTHMMTLIGHM